MLVSPARGRPNGRNGFNTFLSCRKKDGPLCAGVCPAPTARSNHGYRWVGGDGSLQATVHSKELLLASTEYAV